VTGEMGFRDQVDGGKSAVPLPHGPLRRVPSKQQKYRE